MAAIDATAKAGAFNEDVASPQSGIWWLASYPKSGNTWVRFFLNCAITRFPARLNSCYQYATTDLLVSAYQGVLASPLTLADQRQVIYGRPASLMHQLVSAGGRDICLKTHNANLSIDDIPLCPAKLSKGALYLVRDPRDLAISFAKHMGTTIDEAITLMESPNCIIEKRGFPLFHYLSTWTTHVRSWLDTKNPIPTSWVRYEDLLAQPEETFREVAEILGMRDSLGDADIAYGIEQSQFQRLKAAEESGGFAERGHKQDKFFHQGTAGHWQNILTPEQVGRIESAHGEVMRELGYQLT